VPDYRRYYIPNSIIFITAVTQKRRPYLYSPDDVTLFFSILERVQQLHPFHLHAYVILPDHFHWLMRVMPEEDNFSIVLNSIKRNYTKYFKNSHQISTSLPVWQRGFWDHVIRDEYDMKNHFDYIHWNPVKHGYVE
jgi:putative transposase